MGNDPFTIFNISQIALAALLFIQNILVQSGLESSARTQRLARRTVQQTMVMCNDEVVTVGPDFTGTEVEVAAEEVYQCAVSTLTTSGIQDAFTNSCETQTYKHYATFSVLFVRSLAVMRPSITVSVCVLHCCWHVATVFLHVQVLVTCCRCCSTNFKRCM